MRFDPEALGGALRPIRMPEAHGHAGNVIVVGDTAQFGSCQALDLPRRLCDESVEGGRASWMLAVLGALHDRQPRFYEGGPRGTSKARRRPA
ncbi:MAG: hypothetical protein IT374_19430 [Polyangiaceae bacterium]|nr:hypothetical protein [Polyangiaceae bacterium]